MKENRNKTYTDARGQTWFWHERGWTMTGFTYLSWVDLEKKRGPLKER